MQNNTRAKIAETKTSAMHTRSRRWCPTNARMPARCPAARLPRCAGPAAARRQCPAPGRPARCPGACPGGECPPEAPVSRYGGTDARRKRTPPDPARPTPGPAPRPAQCGKTPVPCPPRAAPGWCRAARPGARRKELPARADAPVVPGIRLPRKERWNVRRAAPRPGGPLRKLISNMRAQNENKLPALPD